MSLPRFHIPGGTGWEPGTTVVLPSEERRHALRSLRLRAGDAVECFDGAGRTARGTLVVPSKNECAVLLEKTVAVPPSAPETTIAFAPPKGKRMATLVEQLTELGADVLQPLLAERGVAAGGDPAKWEARALEACKQCGRAWLPTIRPAVTPVEAVGDAPASPERVVLLAAPDGDSSVDRLRERLASVERVLWLVGPEGGFTEEEIDGMTRAGATPTAVAPHILRIGTAAAFCAGLTRFLVSG